MEQGYETIGACYGEVKWEPLDSEKIKRYSKKPTFLDMAQRYNDLKYSFDNARMEIEKQYPFISDAFRLLGFQEIRRLRTKKAVQEALQQAKVAKCPNRNEVFKLISEKIEVGRFYERCELKEICESYGLRQIKELKEWYEIKSTTRRIDGVPKSGYLIKAIKA